MRYSYITIVLISMLVCCVLFRVQLNMTLSYSKSFIFCKISRVTVLLFLWIIIMSAFYTHHPDVSSTFIHLFMSTHINNICWPQSTLSLQDQHQISHVGQQTVHYFIYYITFIFFIRLCKKCSSVSPNNSLMSSVHYRGILVPAVHTDCQVVSS